ncbi:MAG: hypothetical protein CFE29_03705 [Bradyrhizobiaceae bacterium PARB1]|jgi:hypothetical protein|nr:MAG: hypothetical protein CFE29_03705 [Bradyrhizobiaceae bacterium PARB1]
MSHFAIQQFGFNKREIFMLLQALNGIAISVGMVPTTRWLCEQVSSAMNESHADFKEFGKDLATQETDPEIPFSYQDLLEKLTKLADWQSIGIYYYANGFFDGRSLSNHA